MSRVLLIPGDGMGPKLTAQVVKVLGAVQERSGLDLHVVTMEGGVEGAQPLAQAEWERRIESLRDEFDAIFMGSAVEADGLEASWASGFRHQLIARLDLFIHFRPVLLLDERRCPLKDKKAEDIQFVVFSDNSEGMLPELGGFYRKGTAAEVSLRQIISTRQGADRMVRQAFEYARSHGLKRLVLSCQVHTAHGEDDLLTRVFEERRKEYGDIESSALPVSSLMAQLLRTPERFDVILTSSFYADAIGNLGAELQGSVHLGAGADIHPGKISLFMPAEGGRQNSRPNAANPLGAMSAVAMMLEHLGLDQEAQWVIGAVRNALISDNATPDLGGRLDTQQVGDFLAQQIKRAAC